MNRLSRLLREPLLHFLAIGGLIFLSLGAVTTPSQGPADTIVVGPEQVAQLTARFRSVWQRPPTEDERRALIDDFVREEVYYREALALGLDRNDTVVRRRLRQKMEFLTDTAADLLEPAAGEFEAYFAANGQKYQSRPQLSFEQIYLGENPDPDSVSMSLSELRSNSGSDPSALGKSTLLPGRLGLSPPNTIDGVFGKGFFERVAEFPPGTWAGPANSAYGVHLVRVLDSLTGRMPPLEEVRDAVLRDWKAAKTAEIRESHYAQLRERYVVEIKGADVKSAEKR